MSIIKLPLCSECGVPHVPDEVASRVRSGEDITVEIIPHSNGLVKNVLRWGTGGLNIDATRIGLNGIEHHKTPGSGAIGTQNGIYNSSKEPINRKQIERAEQGLNPRYEPLGRFPSNTLFSHTPLCRQTGVKRVRGDGHKVNNPINRQGRGFFGEDKPHVSKGERYNDPDGMETVDAWECDPSCPVRILGEQSGVTSSHGGGHVTRIHFNSPAKYNAPIPKGDTGTAARYFAQFSPSPDELEAPFYYCSKASKSERNKGCEGLPEVERRDYDNGKGLGHTIPRCPEHNASVVFGTNNYKCGCPIVYGQAQPMFKLRSDLTPEQVAYVEQELAKIGGTI